MGPETISAIIAFQSKFLSAPDGRVDLGGVTWTKLAASDFVQLPQVSGFGYYTYSVGTRFHRGHGRKRIDHS